MCIYVDFNMRYFLENTRTITDRNDIQREIYKKTWQTYTIKLMIALIYWLIHALPKLPILQIKHDLKSGLLVSSTYKSFGYNFLCTHVTTNVSIILIIGFISFFLLNQHKEYITAWKRYFDWKWMECKIQHIIIKIAYKLPIHFHYMLCVEKKLYFNQ